MSNTQLQYDILQLNKDQLYEQGVYADGKPTGNYSRNTIYGTSQYAGKIEKGQRFDHLTFLDKGALYASFKIKNEGQDYRITADTIKNGVDLQQRDGKIVGLTSESKSTVAQWVRPLYLKETRAQIFK